MYDLEPDTEQDIVGYTFTSGLDTCVYVACARPDRFHGGRTPITREERGIGARCDLCGERL